MSSGSALGFLRRGVMMARRWLSGRQPCWRDVLHIAVKYGNSSGRNCLTMVVGTGSSAVTLRFR